MSWSNERRAAFRDLMRQRADAARCPRCGRGGAVVSRFNGQRHRAVCQWVARGKCDWDPYGTHRDGCEPLGAEQEGV